MADLKEVGFCPVGFFPVGFCPHTSVTQWLETARKRFFTLFPYVFSHVYEIHFCISWLGFEHVQKTETVFDLSISRVAGNGFRVTGNCFRMFTEAFYYISISWGLFLGYVAGNCFQVLESISSLVSQKQTLLQQILWPAVASHGEALVTPPNNHIP